MSSATHGISIWFFVGLLLSAYGAIILGVGLYHLVVPPGQHIVLAHLHADLWWGGILLAVGVFYGFHFFPRKREE